MCSPVSCRVCGKTTWSGCGQHVDQVKARVPAGQWCEGHETEPNRGSAEPNRGFLASFLRR